MLNWTFYDESVKVPPVGQHDIAVEPVQQVWLVFSDEWVVLVGHSTEQLLVDTKPSHLASQQLEWREEDVDIPEDGPPIMSWDRYNNYCNNWKSIKNFNKAPSTNLPTVQRSIITQTVTEQMTFTDLNIHRDENALKKQSC